MKEHARDLKVVILAAGIGLRIGHDRPKALLEFADGRTILQHQIDGLTRYLERRQIWVVVGFQKDRIASNFPALNYIENPDYRTTNTACSLLLALERLRGSTVLFLEGDIVCDHRVFQRVLGFDGPAMAVHRIPTGDEEMKYTTGPDGTIARLSKGLTNGEGEALAVNKFDAVLNETFIHHLRRCRKMDFFERAIEGCIGDGTAIFPVDVSDLYGIEIDFPEDLEAANALLRSAGEA